jgi:hypothetical protein
MCAALAAAQTAYDDAVQVANFAHRKYALGYLRLTHGYHTTKSVRKQNLALTLRTHCLQQAEFRRVCADLWVQLVSTLSNEELISAAPVWDVEWLEVCVCVCMYVCTYVRLSSSVSARGTIQVHCVVCMYIQSDAYVEGCVVMHISCTQRAWVFFLCAHFIY